MAYYSHERIPQVMGACELLPVVFSAVERKHQRHCVLRAADQRFGRLQKRGREGGWCLDWLHGLVEGCHAEFGRRGDEVLPAHERTIRLDAASIIEKKRAGEREPHVMAHRVESGLACDGRSTPHE